MVIELIPQKNLLQPTSPEQIAGYAPDFDLSSLDLKIRSTVFIALP